MRFSSFSLSMSTYLSYYLFYNFMHMRCIYETLLISVDFSFTYRHLYLIYVYYILYYLQFFFFSSCGIYHQIYLTSTHYVYLSCYFSIWSNLTLSVEHMLCSIWYVQLHQCSYICIYFVSFLFYFHVQENVVV